MDDNQQPDDPYHHHDLPPLEQPGPRADPLFERQTDDTELAGHGFHARLHSETPARSPTATTTALTRLVLAAGLSATTVIAGGRALGITGALVLVLAFVVFVLTGGVGLFLILRIDHSTYETPPDQDNTPDRTPRRHRTDHRQRHDWRPVHKLNLIRFHKAAQPPRQR